MSKEVNLGKKVIYIGKTPNVILEDKCKWIMEIGMWDLKTHFLNSI